MIRIAVVAATAVLFCCATASADPPKYVLSNHPSQDGRCIGDNGIDDLDRSEPACLAQIGELARCVGPGLQLKFRNGLTRVYANEDAKCRSDEAKGCVKYQLTRYFPNHDLLLIEVDHWEGASWLLVRADTGNVSEVISLPHYSPGKRWLVSVVSSTGPSGAPDGIDVVPAANDPALREWHYRVPGNDSWLCEFAGWDGDDRLKLLATSAGTSTKVGPLWSSGATEAGILRGQGRRRGANDPGGYCLNPIA